ncbi:MAG: hypothetical protein ACN6PQ_02350 [Stenotrophomonas indicatrix]|uniref:hypothetical protein n=1 Tax=Stenotrophomonas indicatrix TaxID=2045451 RepID=UPI003D0A764B
MTTDKTPATLDAVRNLIVCDTQFTWAGVTNLTMPQMMDLQARGWVVEGDSNDEFQLTEAGEAVVARALEHGAPATLATVKHGGCVRLATVPYDRARELIGDAYNAGTHGIGYSQQAMELHDAVITAQPSPTIASPAQAVDLANLPHGIRLIEIPCRNHLDPINVFVQDYELGRGRIVVTCYGQAWCGFWGAMGDRTVMQFVAACDADYVAGNMLSGRHEHVKKHERVYVERIAAEVIAEFRALIDSQVVGNG